MDNSKNYWTGLDELDKTEAYQEGLENEFPAQQKVDEFLADDRLKETNTGRRDFLKFMGFSLAAATLAACETPVVKSVPYVVKPEEITPGVPNYYASTYYDGHDYGSVMVKTREGRPIFIKGNKYHGHQAGALNARITGSVIDLYDSSRLKGPVAAGQAATWDAVDAAVASGLSSARNVVVLSASVASPTTQRAINAFATKYNAKHVQYDAVSYSGISEANRRSFGSAMVPTYDFSKAKTIVSIGADFLANWLNSNLYAPQYGMTRRPEGEWMSRHFQFETTMSLTGTNADTRVMINPSDEGKVAAALYELVSGSGSGKVDGVSEMALQNAANALKATKGASLVVAGSNNPDVQEIVNAINQSLGSYGSTIDTSKPLNMFKGDDKAMTQLVRDMKGGQVDALIVYGVNPSYSWYAAEEFNEGLAKVKTSVSFSGKADETAARCGFICPDSHYLESWNDLSLTEGRVDLVQPAITPLFDTRQAQETLLKWAGVESDYYTFLRSTYNASYDMSMMYTDSDWNAAVHNGYMMAAATPVAEATVVEDASAEAPAASNLSAAINAVKKISGGSMQLAIYQKTAIGNGAHASNPYAQELPDPVTKVTWDNYVTMARSDMEAMGLNIYIAQLDHASLVKVTAGGREVVLPAYMQPGQKPGTIGIALGYGRGANGENIGRAAFQTAENGDHLTDENGALVPVGKNVFPMATMMGGYPVLANMDVSVEAMGEEYPLASTQMHHTYMGRESVVKETTLGAFLAEKDKKKGYASWNRMHALNVHEDTNNDGEINASDKKSTREFDLWHDHAVENVGHRWGMTIDLSSCIGCGDCVTACHIENNVPVVGKDEVRRHRDMHWLRIDRFYSSDYTMERGEEEGLGAISTYRKMEDPAENPQTVHMPMMCQHCNHAPCETVCPVAATTHSNEGLNQMTYNRCIGTRYCANNCPYKVRRFNWFNYMGYDKFKNVNPAQDMLTRMVLNPDVTVRARGVMEKCSMCVQRIQAGKLEAKKASAPVQDGAIQTACAESCSVNAIHFGDLNDQGSNVKKISENNRSYHALEEIGVQPNIYYMAKVRNIEDQEA
ncbi:MAG: TAT-variant-translocated molybdopterin oxidoreductase [Flavobacteriales bacterium]|nr:TAT-variant-translocated molybdopterin oxidoreductase [Flavobacteriales bacterium]